MLTSAELSREQKIEILNRWEYDAPELQVAEEENMLFNSDQPDILDEIVHCLHALGAGLWRRLYLDDLRVGQRFASKSHAVDEAQI